jgi:multiple sugar transport system permease protein/raffinose/stachyose/melibiose transport system permease protein
MPALKRALLLLLLCLYTAFAAGPSCGRHDVAQDHDRDPPQPLRPAESGPLGEVLRAWFNSNYGIYFANSSQIVVSAVLILTIVGSMAAHCLARYKFRLNRAIYFILFSTIIFPRRSPSSRCSRSWCSTGFTTPRSASPWSTWRSSSR